MGLLVIWISYCVQITVSQAILPDIYETQWCSVTSISSKPFGLYQSSVHGIFFRQEYWAGLPFPPRDLPDLGIELASPVSCTANGFFTTEPSGNPWREGFITDDILALAVLLFLLSPGVGGEAWHAAIHGVTKSRTWLNVWSDLIWSEPCLTGIVSSYIKWLILLKNRHK